MGCGCGGLAGLTGAFAEKDLKLLDMARKNEYAVSCHPHSLKLNGSDNGWACDGRKAEGGCLNKCTDFHQTKGWARYRCDQCDYDLCDKCCAKNLAL